MKVWKIIYPLIDKRTKEKVNSLSTVKYCLRLLLMFCVISSLCSWTTRTWKQHCWKRSTRASFQRFMAERCPLFLSEILKTSSHDTTTYLVTENNENHAFIPNFWACCVNSLFKLWLWAIYTYSVTTLPVNNTWIYYITTKLAPSPPYFSYLYWKHTNLKQKLRGL